VTESFFPCVLIPVFNHGSGLIETIADLAPLQVRCVVVDDGSDAECRAVIDHLANSHAWVSVVRRPHNGGKGAAMKDGLRVAYEHGHSHALQIDADRQHDCADVERFLRAAESHRDAFIVGAARFDDSVPAGRRIARRLTHFWVWINTLSFDIEDSMCGFRVYPLASVTPLLRERWLGDRMDFDVEILVRAHWGGHAILNLPTKVQYPLTGVSHFRLVRDNVLISAMHARSFLGMLFRLPVLIRRHAQR
jgi:glycosyltransferase involved in cell wall biosynthesis